MVFIPSFAIPQEIAFLTKYGHPVVSLYRAGCTDTVLILIPVLRGCDFTPVNFILRDSKEFFRLNFSTGEQIFTHRCHDGSEPDFREVL